MSVYYYSLIPIFRGFCPQRVSSTGGFVLRVFYSGGFIHRGFCPHGFFIQGVLSTGGFVLRVFCPDTGTPGLRTTQQIIQ